MIQLVMVILVWSAAAALAAKWLARKPWGAGVVLALIGVSGTYFVGLIRLFSHFAEVFR